MSTAQPTNPEPASEAPAVAPPPTPPKAQPRRLSTRATLIIVGVIVVLGPVSGLIIRAAENGASGGAMEDRVNGIVDQANTQVQFPMEVDSITTWTGIEAEHDAVHYDYTIAAEVDPSTITTDRLHDTVAPSVCSISETKEALSTGIDFTYTYGFEGTDKTLDFTITKADCG